VTGRELLPRILLGGLEREADALAVEIDLEDLYLDLVAHRDDRAGMVDVLPGQLRDVHEAVHAAQVDEGAEVDHRGHHTAAALAGLEVLEELLALLALGLLEPRPAGQDHVVAVLVELDDLGLEDLAHVGLQVTDPAQLHQGGGQEAPQADVQDETTLDDLDDRAGDHALGLLDLLDLAPGQFVLGPLLGQDQAAVLVLLGQDQGVQAVAQRHDLGRVHVVADRQLTAGDHALGLVPDVQQHLVVIDLDHRAGDELAVLDLDHARRIGVVEAGAEIVLDDLARDVVPLRIEGPEQGLVGGRGIGDCGRRGGGVVGHG